MSSKHLAQGQHGILDLYNINPSYLIDGNFILSSLKKAAKSANSTIIDEKIHQFKDNNGISAFLMLAESHISIHTWPEDNFAAVDIFLCGKLKIKAAYQSILKDFNCQDYSIQVIERGRI